MEFFYGNQIAHMDKDVDLQYFLDMLYLFHEMQWLYNNPVTEILSQGSLDHFPKDWMNSLYLLNTNELNDFVVQKRTKSDWPTSLCSFIEKCIYVNKLSNKDAIFYTHLPKNFATGMSCKKQHEIIQLANMVHVHCNVQGIQRIVDLGAGLGYVCQLLHYLYGYQVLGLEANEDNVKSASQRQYKLYPESINHVKYVTCKLTESSTALIETLIKNEFQEVEDVCLIGLHVCGDLSIYASKIFANMICAKILISIPCCYHKFSIAKSIPNTNEHKQYFTHFPVSNTLQRAIEISRTDIGLFLRQPFLRLACQETAERWTNMSTMCHNQHAFHVLARAVVQLHANQNNFTMKKVVRKGTRKSQCTDFETYIKDFVLRYSFERGIEKQTEINVKEIIQLWNENCEKLKSTEIYTGLQLILQGPAESFVLQDHICWLQEQNFEAKIVPLMNRTLSPRSHAIVSQKK